VTKASSKRDVVLLFYKDFETDRYVRFDRYAKKVFKPLYSRIANRPSVTGFKMWFDLLVLALEREGYDVHVNDLRFARTHPSYPVGLVGYPHLLDGWDLPNPAVLGPGLFDHPCAAPNLMQDDRFCYYLLTCEWMLRMFQDRYGDTCATWYAGIDTTRWTDSSSHAKDIDVVVYDKVRWNRDVLEPTFIQPILQELNDRGLTTEVIRYGQYNHRGYASALLRSRSMLFLCEHETQGMAYQEALACNIPVLAWDNGYWLDPQRPQFEAEPVPATSVPYFDSSCGERFRDLDEFREVVGRFLGELQLYRPRAFVEQQLSLSGSARLYMSYYERLRGRQV
jgi:hypothetical protein